MPDLTASQITADALLILRKGGARVRRVNNVGAYKKRANQVEPGAADIQGYSSKGVHIECEVKKIGDTLKIDQRLRLIDIRDCGGLAYVATEKNGSTVIYTITEYLLT